MKSSSLKKKPPVIQRLAKGIYFAFSLLLALAITLKAVQFLEPNFEEENFLKSKESFFQHFKWPLYVHMFSAPLSILLGILQFSTRVSKAHKWIGITYVACILFFAAPSGFAMAFFAIGGWPSIINFVLLSLLWFWYTLRAYRLAKQKQYELHRQYMIRSFLLANSAILLRLLGFVNLQVLGFDPYLAYPYMAWLSWLPGLLYYEAYLYRQNRKAASL